MENNIIINKNYTNLKTKRMKQLEMYQNPRSQRDHSNDFLPKKRTQKDYSDDFKLMVVREFEQGFIRISDLSRKYGIQAHSTISKWVDEFGSKKSTDTLKIKLREVKNENIFLRKQIELLNKQYRR